MALEQVDTGTIALPATASALSPMDRSLEVIRSFLSVRLAERKSNEQITPFPEIVLDVAFLPGKIDSPPDFWRHKIIYPIRVHFSTILLGPVYHPLNEGAPCPCCLERRWIANRSKKEQQAYQKAQAVLITGSHPTLHPAALEMLWTVVEWSLFTEADPAQDGDNGLVSRWMDGAKSAGWSIEERRTGESWFYALHLDTLQLQQHQLIADSSCPVCARPEPDRAYPAAYQLQERPKPDPFSYRLVDPLDYTLPERGYVNAISGMLGREPGLDLVHTVTAPVTGQYYLRGSEGINMVGWGGHTTRFHVSRRVGILEGLERYCGHWPRARYTTVIDSYTNLAAHALDPLTCGSYLPEFYASSYARFLQPFTPERPIAWVWGYSLLQQRPILVPEQLAYYFPSTHGIPEFVSDSSNGCAIGSCLEEAILYGLLELVERDNFMFHWYAKIAAPQIDPWSSQSVKTLRLLDRIERLGYDTYLLDTRLDLPFPTVTAVAVLRHDDIGKLALAAGAGFDPEEAIRSALCELAAYLPSIPQRVKAELSTFQALASDFTRVMTIEHHSLLYALPEMFPHARFLLENKSIRPVSEIYAAWNAQRPGDLDLCVDLQYSVERVFDLGMDVIVVDQTAPELQGTGLKVARVIIPGLIPIDFGWAYHRVANLPRVRTLPRTLGYRESDVDPALLNFTPHPFP